MHTIVSYNRFLLQEPDFSEFMSEEDEAREILEAELAQFDQLCEQLEKINEKIGVPA